MPGGENSSEYRILVFWNRGLQNKVLKGRQTIWFQASVLFSLLLVYKHVIHGCTFHSTAHSHLIFVQQITFLILNSWERERERERELSITWCSGTQVTFHACKSNGYMYTVFFTLWEYMQSDYSCPLHCFASICTRCLWLSVQSSISLDLYTVIVLTSTLVMNFNS